MCLRESSSNENFDPKNPGQKNFRQHIRTWTNKTSFFYTKKFPNSLKTRMLENPSFFFHLNGKYSRSCFSLTRYTTFLISQPAFLVWESVNLSVRKMGNHLINKKCHIGLRKKNTIGYNRNGHLLFITVANCINKNNHITDFVFCTVHIITDQSIRRVLFLLLI